ncbi:MAG: hypothetical protein R2693_05825 [Nocardioidaceae bacterium]
MAAGERTEDSQARVAVFVREGLEDGSGGFEQYLGMNLAQFGGKLELLTNSRLGDAERLSDLALRSARGDHSPQCEDASESGNVLGMPGAAVLGQQGHK